VSHGAKYIGADDIVGLVRVDALNSVVIGDADRFENKKNNRNTPAYQGRKLGAGYT
jgi:hypothetical protein